MRSLRAELRDVSIRPSLMSLEVALLLRNPEGSQPLAGGRRRRTTGKPAKTSLHPGGMPANLPLASLRDAISTIPCFRWCRFAQPPANRCDPSELNRKCATSKLTLRVIKEVLKQLLPLCLQKHEPGDVTPPGSCFFRPRSLSISHLALFQMADTQQRRSFTRT